MRLLKAKLTRQWEVYNQTPFNITSMKNISSKALFQSIKSIIEEAEPDCRLLIQSWCIHISISAKELLTCSKRKQASRICKETLKILAAKLSKNLAEVFRR
jgi:hypothetical protein